MKSSWTPRVRSGLRLRRGAARLFDPTIKLERLIGMFGAPIAAQLLGMSTQRVSAYARSTIQMEFEVARRIDDLEYVLSRALRIMQEDEVGAWLTEPEPLLGGATPLNTLAWGGVEPVVCALDGLYAGVLV